MTDTFPTLAVGNKTLLEQALSQIPEGRKGAIVVSGDPINKTVTMAVIGKIGDHWQVQATGKVQPHVKPEAGINVVYSW